MRLQLSPRELGEIDVHMVSDSEGVHVTFFAEQASTGKLLETQLDQLRASLVDSGVHLSGLDIGQHNQSGQKGGGFEQNPNFTQNFSRNFPDAQPASQEKPGLERSLGRSSDVDYFNLIHYFEIKEKDMQVNNVTNASQVTANSTVKTAMAGANKMDSDQFMQILMAQLTHQNPLEPMDNAEMMSQFSQLNSLQELREIHTGMDKLSTSNQVMYLSSLIGKTVKVNRTDGKVVEGIVEGVVIEKDNPQLRIDNEEYPLDDVIEIEGDDL